MTTTNTKWDNEFKIINMVCCIKNKIKATIDNERNKEKNHFGKEMQLKIKRIGK